MIKLGGIFLGSGLFLYANYGGLLAARTSLPTPAAVLRQVTTFRLSATAKVFLSRLFNSLATGPLIVAGFALVMNGLLTHPALKITPLVRHTLPRRYPVSSVVVNATLGTLFYRIVSGIVTENVILLP